MKILFNTYQGAFQKPGGGELIILKLYSSLREKGIKVDLYNQWKHKFCDYDIIHHFTFHEWDIWEHYLAEKVILAVTPTFWCFDSKLQRIKNDFKHFYKQYIINDQYSLRNALKLPHAFFPTTSLEMERIKKHFRIKPTYHVLPNGISKPTMLSDDFPRDDHNEKYLLFVGNITPIKNVDKIIKAAKTLNHHLHIIGSAPIEYQDYYNYCKSISNDLIHFRGPIENNSPRLAHAYDNAAGVIVASRFETCSLVGLEAGSYGKPLAITQNGGTKEIFKNHALYLDPNSQTSITQTIKKILEQNGNNAALQNHILQNYTWDIITERLLENYNKLIANNCP